MTLEEKLRFLANRAEDGMEFNTGIGVDYCFVDGRLCHRVEDKYQLSDVSLVALINHSDDFKLKPRWTFTEDEKAILRNLPSDYRFIARDNSESLFIYAKKPIKSDWGFHHLRKSKLKSLGIYKHLFQSIQWTDDEPCEFRKYL